MRSTRSSPTLPRALQALAVLALPCLAGCSSPPPKPAAPPPRPSCTHFPVELFVEGDGQLNLNDRGQSMPVEVRAFLLRDRQKIDALDLEGLGGGAEKALAPDLLLADAFVVYPGKEEIRPLKCPRETAFVALAGMFRTPEGQGWKLVFDVREAASRCAAGELHTMVHAVLKGSAVLRGRASQGRDEPGPK